MNSNFCPVCKQRFRSPATVSMKHCAPKNISWYSYVQPYHQCDKCGVNLNKEVRYPWVFYGLAAFTVIYLLLVAFVWQANVKEHFPFAFMGFMVAQAIHCWLCCYYTEKAP